MNLPDHITRAQLEAAFAELGLDAGEVVTLTYDRDQAWISCDLADERANIEYIAAAIPILDAAPQPAGDLLGEIEEARA